MFLIVGCGSENNQSSQNSLPNPTSATNTFIDYAFLQTQAAILKNEYPEILDSTSSKSVN